MAEEFGVRVDSLKFLKDILDGAYHPQNEINQAIYSEMKKWEEYYGNPPFKYVYYGSEFCKKRFPSVAEWRDMASFCMERDQVLVMIIPQTDDEMQQAVLDIICEFYEASQMKQFEVVVNDFGMLEKLNKLTCLKEHIVVRLGRILDKTYHDGRLNDRELIRLYRDCSIKWAEDEHWIPQMQKKVFRRYPIKGMDLDIPTITSMCSTKKEEEEYSIGMFVPYSYTTTGGICQMQSIGILEEEKFSSLNKNCFKNCTKYYEKLKKKVIDINDENSGLKNGYNYREIVMYRVGNTIYYMRNCDIAAMMKHSSIKRLIFEPKLMI